MRAEEYGTRKAELLPRVLASFAKIGEAADIVLVEGAGSPAEVNLRAGDIANMGFAEATGIPVVLLGDIDRGGVIASLVGTHAVLPEADRGLIRGFIVNKFRGDRRLFEAGLRVIAERTGWQALGWSPGSTAPDDLPAEDVLGLAERSAPRPGGVVIAVPALPRIANFDDLDPLRLEPGVSVVIVRPGRPIPAEATLVLLPGSKATIADLAALRQEGWDIDILAHRRRGGRVLGLCGGYQMLGRTIADPEGIEGRPGTVAGLGLLAVETVIAGDKTTVAARGRHAATGSAIAGYEIHVGDTDGEDCARPFADLGSRKDGAISSDGLVAGTYLHGIFGEDGFRRAFLGNLGAPASAFAYETTIEATIDALAAHLEKHVDIDRLLAMAAAG